MARVRRYQDGGDVNDLLKMLKEYKGAPTEASKIDSLATDYNTWLLDNIIMHKGNELIAYKEDEGDYITESGNTARYEEWVDRTKAYNNKVGGKDSPYYLDIKSYENNRFPRAKSFIEIEPAITKKKVTKPVNIKPLKSLLKEIEQDPVDKELQDSTSSIPTSRRNTELMYKLNANMRTGQEPDKYKVWDEKGKKWSMRDVEPEELEYYRNKNKIQEKQIINASFNDGGRVKKPLTRRDPKNTYTPSENMSMEDIERIMSLQGGFPLEAAEVYSDSGPRKMNQQEMMKALGGYGLEAARLLPFIGEALDLGDIVSASQTGKDLSGYDATPEGRAAMFGAMLLIPNIIEKPAKWLVKQGAKSADDVRRILSSYANKNAADIPADLKPLLDLSKKSNEMKLYLDQSNIPYSTKLGTPDRIKYGAEEWTADLLQGTPSDASVNWLVKNRPEQVLKFSPENFNKGMFDADYSDWADSYLTSLRGVQADNIDIAADAIRGPKRPMGHIHGDGTYQTSNLDILGAKGKTTGYGVGSKGYIGASRNVPGVGQKGQKASDILSEINLLEAHGGSYPIIKDASGNWLYDTSIITRDTPKGMPIQIRNPKGIHTKGKTVRIVRPNTAKLTGILDIAKSDDQVAIDALMSKYGKNIDWGGVGQFSNQNRLGLNELYEKIAQGKKYQDGGSIFKKLRQKRTDRRIAKTPVRDASSQEVLEMLSSYGADSPMMQGEYDPREKEIVMYKDDADTLKHEQVHATQYGPLQRLAYRMNQDRSAPIQDPTKRKVYRKLSENISPEAYAAFNRAGKLILDKGEEFEAVLDTGVNAAKEKGVNFNVSFEEILSQLKNIPSPTNNMIGLMKFMENRFTREQRDLILKSIR